MNFNIKNSFKFFLFLILILGITRFIYATAFKENVSLFNSTYAESSYDNYFIKKNTDRAWGPIAITMIGGIKEFIPKNYTSFVWRLGLISSYGIIIYFLFKLLSEFKLILKNNNHNYWGILLIFFTLQSSSALYGITNGGEMFTSLSIIGHFYFFNKKKYFISSVFIVFGIYFKFHPAFFALPYFVFALFSTHHRIYIFYVIVVGLFISIISFPIQGLLNGSLYPLSIIFAAFKDSSNTIPIWSQEIFNPISLINKIIYGFKIKNSYSNTFNIYPITNFIINLFALLFIFISICSGYILSKYEKNWKNNDQLRFLNIFYFQIIIGYIYLIFSVDVSIEHLLIPIISIYAPIFLFSASIHHYSDLDISKTLYIIAYFIGLILIGGFLPISVISNLIPYDFIDNIVSDNTKSIGQYGRFIWYHLPLLGLIIIGNVILFFSRNLFKKL